MSGKANSAKKIPLNKLDTTVYPKKKKRARTVVHSTGGMKSKGMGAARKGK